MTDGETLDEVLFNASEALSGIYGMDAGRKPTDPRSLSRR